MTEEKTLEYMKGYNEGYFKAEEDIKKFLKNIITEYEDGYDVIVSIIENQLIESNEYSEYL